MTQTIARRSLADTFAHLRRQQRIGLFPFIPAGYPDLPTTAALLPALEAAGASAVEIGFPFSDSIADGPVIQAAFSQALSKKITVRDIFDTIATTRGAIAMPLVAMVSYSIVYRYGPDRFLADAKTAGFDAILAPDLPPPEGERFCAKVRAAGLDTVLLLAPSTAAQRRKEIADLCSGFIYYLSVTGITGARDALPPDLQSNVRQIKTLTRQPVAVGFGVSQPEHLRQMALFADAAIVGSAIVRIINNHLKDGPVGIAGAVGAFCRELLGAPGTG